MTVREAERDAERLLESWWIVPFGDAPLPVNPVLLAEQLGIDVQETRLPADQSGNIKMPAGGRAVISLNQSDSWTRRRFTCAHEIGHYIRRDSDSEPGSATFVDYRSTLAGLGVDQGEIYANQFAAALLMPARLVREYFVNKGESIQMLARRFGTSTQAMELRLRNLQLT